jgi:hypothetical protein
VLIGVYSQPLGSFAKWKGRGVNCLLQSESEGGHVTQAQWRAAAAAAGLPYYDRPGVSPEDDARDPFLLGFMMEDEPDRRVILPAVNAIKVATTNGDQAEVARQQKIIDDYVASYTTLANRCRATGKPVFGNLSGPEVTGGYPWYAGQGQKPLMPALTEISFDWYPKNADDQRYGNDLLDRAFTLLKKWAGELNLTAVAWWAILECSFQNKGNGKGPTLADIDEQVDICVRNGVKGICWFPQRIGGGFLYDNTTPEQAQKITDVAARLNPPPVDPLEDLRRRVLTLEQGVSSLGQRLGALEQRVASLEAQAKAIDANTVVGVQVQYKGSNAASLPGQT